MVVVTPVTAGCRSLSRVARLGRSDEGNELPLFKDLAAASSSRMLYPFSKPNEIELSLADVVSAKFKRVSTFNTSILPSVKSDLLKHETEKTESNWLLTPPDSPLFPTLDYEALGASLLPSPKQKSRLSKMSTSHENGDGRRKREVAFKKSYGNNEKVVR